MLPDNVSYPLSHHQKNISNKTQTRYLRIFKAYNAFLPVEKKFVWDGQGSITSKYTQDWANLQY